MCLCYSSSTLFREERSLWRRSSLTRFDTFSSLRTSWPMSSGHMQGYNSLPLFLHLPSFSFLYFLPPALPSLSSSLPPFSSLSFSFIPHLFPQALREFFPSILSLCETLLCSSSPTITTFTTSLYQHLFSTFDVYCRQVSLSVCLSVYFSPVRDAIELICGWYIVSNG